MNESIYFLFFYNILLYLFKLKFESIFVFSYILVGNRDGRLPNPALICSFQTTSYRKNCQPQ